jgi:hypothetical protein
LAEAMINKVAGVDDARVRRLSRKEALRLERGGISVWRRN